MKKLQKKPILKIKETEIKKALEKIPKKEIKKEAKKEIESELEETIETRPAFQTPATFNSFSEKNAFSKPPENLEEIAQPQSIFRGEKPEEKKPEPLYKSFAEDYESISKEEKQRNENLLIKSPFERLDQSNIGKRRIIGEYEPVFRAKAPVIQELAGFQSEADINYVSKLKDLEEAKKIPFEPENKKYRHFR